MIADNTDSFLATQWPVMGIAAELVFPVLLLLGLGGRVAAAGLFIVNMVAVISVAAPPVAALQQHVFWGNLLVALLLWGPGRWSLGQWLLPRLRQFVQSNSLAVGR